jgi:hypothetical protein
VIRRVQGSSIIAGADVDARRYTDHLHQVVGRGFLNPTMMTILPEGTGLASATASGEMFGTHPRLRPTTDGGETG